MARDDAIAALAKACAHHLVRAVEGMAGEPPQTSVTRIPAALEEEGRPLKWHHYTLNLVPGAAILAGATEESSSRFGADVLKAAGVEDSTPQDASGTYIEILNQVISAVVRLLSSEVGREVTTSAPDEGSGPQLGNDAHRILVKMGADEYATTIVFSPELESVLKSSPERVPEPQRKPQHEEAPQTGKSIDLLLDVELPVSVSFGRAQLPLKDVLKLTTGSIVELNRTISEPVEVIVNNCVIARGEVVVVEGNFGVRIQQVMSRQDRIQSLK